MYSLHPPTTPILPACPLCISCDNFGMHSRNRVKTASGSNCGTSGPSIDREDMARQESISFCIAKRMSFCATRSESLIRRIRRRPARGFVSHWMPSSMDRRAMIERQWLFTNYPHALPCKWGKECTIVRTKCLQGPILPEDSMFSKARNAIHSVNTHNDEMQDEEAKNCGNTLSCKPWQRFRIAIYAR